MKNDFIDVNTVINSFDFNIFKQVINQGIDAHLEAFVKSKFDQNEVNNKDKNRFKFLFHVSEIPILLRRLREYGQEEYMMWADDIELVANKKFGENVLTLQ